MICESSNLYFDKALYPGMFFVVWFHPPLSDIAGLKHSAIRASSRFHVWRTGHPPIMRICQSLDVTKNDCWDNQNTVHPNTILHYSGQIIATSHDLGPQNVAFWKGNPIISGKSLVKYYFIWPDYCLAVATETNFPVKMVRFVHWKWWIDDSIDGVHTLKPPKSIDRSLIWSSIHWIPASWTYDRYAYEWLYMIYILYIIHIFTVQYENQNTNKNKYMQLNGPNFCICGTILQSTYKYISRWWF